MDPNNQSPRELSVPKQRGGSSRGRDWYFGDGFELREMLGPEPEVPEFRFKVAFLSCAATIASVSAAIVAARVLSHDPSESPHAAWQIAGFATVATVSGRMALWRLFRSRISHHRYVLADALLLPMSGATAVAARMGSPTVTAVGSMATLAGLVLSGSAVPHIRWFRAATNRQRADNLPTGRGLPRDRHDSSVPFTQRKHGRR